MSSKEHVGVRLELEILARIDALRGRLSTRWVEATRSDVMRALILIGIEHEDELEASLAPAKPSKARSKRRKKG